MFRVLEEVSLIQPLSRPAGAARETEREAGLLLTCLSEGPFFGGTQLPLLCPYFLFLKPAVGSGTSDVPSLHLSRFSLSH